MNNCKSARISHTIEWYTPQWIFEAIPIKFDCDPCSPLAGPVTPAKTHYTIKDNGLAKDWVGHVWMNPPYGKRIDLWFRRLRDHGDGIAVVFARVDAKWWHSADPDMILFPSRRIGYTRDDGYVGSNPVPSALLAYGPACCQALLSSSIEGQHLIPIHHHNI